MAEDLHKKLADNLVEAEKSWRNADNLFYNVMPVVKDRKLLVRVLENLNKSLVLAISGILKFEYLYKRVSLVKDPIKNLETFFKKCAVRYGLNELETKVIREILLLSKKHKESGFEFTKKGKVIILDDDLGINEITVDMVKSGLKASKKLLDCIRVNYSVRKVYI